MTFAIFRRNGLSSSVYKVIASPGLPALPDRPSNKITRLTKTNMFTIVLGRWKPKNWPLKFQFQLNRCRNYDMSKEKEVKKEMEDT
jgi:hypothetical protein